MIVTFADGSTETYDDTVLKQGAEGQIYVSQDRQSVVKLYYPDASKNTERIDRIEKLITNFNPTKSDPYWKQFFSWPEKRVVSPRVGYRMPFVTGLKTIENYLFAAAYKLLKPEEKGWFIGHIACAIKLTSAADRMARMGLCYTDFSEKNIMIDPYAGRTVLIDCDSLTVPGKLPATVEGTSWFRAPEIVSGKVKIPTVETDRHALAVLLYLYLLRGHPLVGDKIFDMNDVDHDDALRYGDQALYIEHPTDHSNRNSKQIEKARMLGPELENLFRTAFVDGLHNPSARPQPIQWHEAFHRTYDRLIPCANSQCDRRFFVALPNGKFICPKCSQSLTNLKTIPYLYLFTARQVNQLHDIAVNRGNAHYVVGWPGRNLHAWHSKPDVTPIYSGSQLRSDFRPIAHFAYDVSKKQWYLKNINIPDMQYRLANDSQNSWQFCAVNENIPLLPNMQIQFGSLPEHYRAQVEMVKVN